MAVTISKSGMTTVTIEDVKCVKTTDSKISEVSSANSAGTSVPTNNATLNPGYFNQTRLSKQIVITGFLCGSTTVTQAVNLEKYQYDTLGKTCTLTWRGIALEGYAKMIQITDEFNGDIDNDTVTDDQRVFSVVVDFRIGKYIKDIDNS